jgi:hypothetical protein
MKRNQWTAALLAVLLFACGILVGALGHRYYAATAVSAKTAEDFRHRYIAEMESRLKLTPAQVSQLETILDETKAQYKAIRDAYHPAMLKIKHEQVAKVKSILTQRQVPEYEKLVAEREQRARQQEERDREEEQKRAAARQSRGAP